MLNSVTNNGINATNSFEYSGGSGELSRVVLPYGGALRWAYRSFTFAGGKTVREVQYRYLAKQSGAAETTYSMLRDDAADANNGIHYFGGIYDPTGATKGWYFAVGPAWWNGLLAIYVNGLGPNIRRQVTSWSQNSSGNPYISSAQTLLDPDTPYQQVTTTTQTLDSHL